MDWGTPTFPMGLSHLFQEAKKLQKDLKAKTAAKLENVGPKKRLRKQKVQHQQILQGLETAGNPILSGDLLRVLDQALHSHTGRGALQVELEPDDDKVSGRIPSLSIEVMTEIPEEAGPKGWATAVVH